MWKQTSGIARITPFPEHVASEPLLAPEVRQGVADGAAVHFEMVGSGGFHANGGTGCADVGYEVVQKWYSADLVAGHAPL